MPTTPSPYTKPTPASAYILESTDEEEDPEAENDDLPPYFYENQNPDPSTMRAEAPTQTGRCRIFPHGNPSSSNSQIPFHPQDAHIDWEDCTAIERARIIAELEAVEAEANRLACLTNRIFNKYEEKKTQLKSKALNIDGKLTLDGFKQLETSRDWERAMFRQRNRDVERRLVGVRNYQNFLSLQLQAVLNGILFRHQNPNVAFVIFIREDSVVIQQTQFQNRDPPPTLPPGPARRRKPRQSMESNNVNRSNRTSEFALLPCCNLAKTNFGIIEIVNLTFNVYHAENVFDYLSLMTAEPKIVVTPYILHQEKFEETFNSMNDLFSVFEWTMGGWFAGSSYYEKLLKPVRDDMDTLRKLLGKNIMDNEKKILLIQRVKNQLLKEMNKDLEWYHTPDHSISETGRIIRTAVKVLLN